MPEMRKLIPSERRKLFEKVKSGSTTSLLPSIDLLALHFLPNATKDGLKRIIEYLNRIMSSRLQPTICGDEMHLVTKIQKKCTTKL
jgi:hypothetical protein